MQLQEEEIVSSCNFVTSMRQVEAIARAKLPHLALYWLHLWVDILATSKVGRILEFRKPNRSQIGTVVSLRTRDDHGNGIPIGNGNPMGIPWEWDKNYTSHGNLGVNGKQCPWEWEWLTFPWELIPIDDCARHRIYHLCEVYRVVQKKRYPGFNFAITSVNVHRF